MVFEMDAIYFLVFIECFVVVFALFLFFFMRARKYKKLCSSVQPVEQQPVAVPSEEIVVEPEAPASEPEPASVPEPEPIAVQEPVAAPEPEPVSEQDELPKDVTRLRELVMYQKGMIVELMGYKEILDGANKKLGSIRDTGGDIQEGVMMLLGALPPSEEQTSTFKKFEQSDKDMDVVLKILEKENAAISSRFEEWDEKFKNLMSGELATPISNDESSSRLAAAEAEIVKKDKEIADMKMQYEGLEAEYLQLYRQHHGSDKPQQPDI
ncbi:MAG: hypothetical protein LLF86_08300 [Nitrospiraceae bacterium]|nr:hypothetical protein [Nitrospiraceae bacterium]